MNPFTVVAAIIKKDNLYLIVQRNKHKYLGLKWEFPGGKIESGETFEEALLREIEEELTPFGFINNGLESDTFVDTGGQMWEVAEM